MSGASTVPRPNHRKSTAVGWLLRLCDCSCSLSQTADAIGLVIDSYVAQRGSAAEDEDASSRYMPPAEARQLLSLCVRSEPPPQWPEDGRDEQWRMAQVYTLRRVLKHLRLGLEDAARQPHEGTGLLPLHEAVLWLFSVMPTMERAREAFTEQAVAATLKILHAYKDAAATPWWVQHAHLTQGQRLLPRHPSAAATATAVHIALASAGGPTAQGTDRLTERCWRCGPCHLPRLVCVGRCDGAGHGCQSCTVLSRRHDMCAGHCVRLLGRRALGDPGYVANVRRCGSSCGQRR